ncbi:UDP-glycosyltransferase 86A1-like isoform X2 [Primulina huaijiensis]|uniref:UDP-glycosyltransferase 86A1-like isoform X2 n=1 Tax=Primulina huaijiensis TaxID=1492673 RepID=UPI003CC78FDA
MATEKMQKRPHAIMISLHFQGHITPFVNLALKIASKGLSVTFVHNEFVHHKLSKSHKIHEFNLFPEACESGLDIRYTTISDGFPVEFDRFLHREEYMESILRDFPARVDEFVGKMIESNPSSATFLVADTLYSWPATIAEKYNLVNVSFWTEPALVFSLDYHLELLRQNGHFPCKEEEINYIPGIESINTRDLMPYLKEAEMATISPKIVINSFREVKKADFILHNTIYELEPATLSALNKNQPNYAIGPISFSQNLAKANPATNLSLWPESDCTKWLSSKPPGSVLYISFGSLVEVSELVIQEIAHGILLSEVNFIWAVRGGMTNALPHGFEDKMKDKGLIVPWCNQIHVLSNPRIGGFLTHCGWNSIQESIWCRVPMICYPLSYDQPTNRKLVVDVWKIGINLSDGVPINRAGIAENVKKFMSASTSKGLRMEARKMKDILRNAIENGGSSDINFDHFIKDLKAKL